MRWWLIFLLSACGAKTGLKVEEAAVDAATDAATDATLEVGPDACVNAPPVALIGQRATLAFVIDASNSMNFGLSGSREPTPDDPSRWSVTIGALETSLRGRDGRLDIGAKLFPNARPNDIDPDEACRVNPRLDLVPRSDNLDELLERMSRRLPAGGTPTARAVEAARRALVDSDDENPKSVVLITDGAPNCNQSLRPPCDCTGLDGCDDPVYGPILCLDERETLTAIDRTFRESGIPVFVIGVEDPSRPQYADVLDRMAIAGGRAREGEERAFYEVRAAEDLVDAFTSITDQIALCVFRAPPGVDVTQFTSLDVEGVPVARDLMRLQGWDVTDASSGEVTLYGLACERASQGADNVAGHIMCPADAG